MELRILAVGDVVGQIGVDYLSRRLRGVKKEYGVDFTVVNGENADGLGILPEQAEDIFLAGADVITLGNHTWNRQQIARTLDENRYILRPANYYAGTPGRGWGVFDGPRGLRIGVINLIGQGDLDPHVHNPFHVADRILKEMDADVTLVDFHAEYTSEKCALGWYLDGRVQALWGTHTHVPTADGRVLDKGTGFVSDLGMTGAERSVLGMEIEGSISRFISSVPSRFKAAGGPAKLESVLFTIDTVSKRCIRVERVDIRG
jgi:metallophosphoesterase (TIGR00282 family)